MMQMGRVTGRGRQDDVNMANEKEVCMRQVRGVLMVAIGILITSLAGSSVLAQTTTGTEVKQFEIVSVDGNTVVVRGEKGVAQEITVPPDFRLTVDGKPVSVAELKPGMKGTARITTTTIVTPVTITEVKKGRVLKVVGNSIIVRTEEGNRMFTEDEVTKRGVRINGPDGKPIRFTDLREGYELSATIVTQKPPQVMTQTQVDAAMSSAAPSASGATPGQAAAKGAAPAAGAGKPAASATGTGGAAGGAAGGSSAARKQLPKTASPLPLLNLVGVAFARWCGTLDGPQASRISARVRSADGVSSAGTQPHQRERTIVTLHGLRKTATTVFIGPVPHDTRRGAARPAFDDVPRLFARVTLAPVVPILSFSFCTLPGAAGPAFAAQSSGACRRCAAPHSNVRQPASGQHRDQECDGHRGCNHHHRARVRLDHHQRHHRHTKVARGHPERYHAALFGPQSRAQYMRQQRDGAGKDELQGDCVATVGVEHTTAVEDDNQHQQCKAGDISRGSDRSLNRSGKIRIELLRCQPQRQRQHNEDHQRTRQGHGSD